MSYININLVYAIFANEFGGVVVLEVSIKSKKAIYSEQNTYIIMDYLYSFRHLGRGTHTNRN